MSSLVVIIEDETTLRQSLVRGIGKLDGVEALGFECLDEALTLFGDRTPALIIADINLPGRSGLDLLPELEGRGIHVPVVFVTAYLEAFADRIPALDAIEVLQKPLALEELRDIVRKKTGAGGQSRAPDRTLFAIAEYVQLACLCGQSILIEVTSAGSTRPDGWITIHLGVLWSAEDSQGQDEAAFLRLVSQPGGDARGRPLKSQPGNRRILVSWQVLLLNAARSMDEHREHQKPALQAPETPGMTQDAARDAITQAPQSAEGQASAERPDPEAPCAAADEQDSVPSLRDLVVGRTDGSSSSEEAIPSLRDLVLETSATAKDAETSDKSEEFDEFVTQRFRDLVDQGMEALLMKDYATALEHLQAAAELVPGDALVEANIKRLQELHS